MGGREGGREERRQPWGGREGGRAPSAIVERKRFHDERWGFETTINTQYAREGAEVGVGENRERRGRERERESKWMLMDQIGWMLQGGREKG
jgi:hypothetical protein